MSTLLLNNSTLFSYPPAQRASNIQLTCNSGPKGLAWFVPSEATSTNHDNRNCQVELVVVQKPATTILPEPRMAKAISLSFFCHILKSFFIISSCNDGIIKTNVFTLMFIYSNINQAGIFVPLKLVNCIIH